MLPWTRRHLIQSAGLVLAAPVLAQSRQPRFGFAQVVDRAESLAEHTFIDNPDPEPEKLQKLDYDDYRKLRFRPEARIPLGGGFSLDLFHRGHIFKRRVGVNIVRNGEAIPLPYLDEQFDFGGLDIGPFPETLGFAGIRLRYPLNRPDVHDELMVFLGASYFRFLGRGQRYGLSARGLAINAATPGLREEFPFFKEFWIEEGEATQARLNIYALLDSPSVTGAFSFTLLPGQNTIVDVKAALIPRVDIDVPGIAPLTSMFLTGSSDTGHIDLFRREVHDSDGLLVKRDDMIHWRLLRNPETSAVSMFSAQQVHGFGLLQRNRSFDDYQDLEAHYEMRPGYYVEPVGQWGPGAIQLSELVTESEIHDNIFAAFRPSSPLRAEEKTEWRYRLIATGSGEDLTPLARAQRTMTSDIEALRIGEAAGTRLYMVDFCGADLAFYKRALDEFELSVRTTNGTVQSGPLVWNAHADAVRARIYALIEPGQSAEISAQLLRRGQPVSETWLTHWSRDTASGQEQAQTPGVR